MAGCLHNQDNLIERLLAGAAGRQATSVRESFGIQVFVTVCECECDDPTAGRG